METGWIFSARLPFTTWIDRLLTWRSTNRTVWSTEEYWTETIKRCFTSHLTDSAILARLLVAWIYEQLLLARHSFETVRTAALESARQVPTDAPVQTRQTLAFVLRVRLA